MNIQELIFELERIYKQHGNLRVTNFFPYGNGTDIRDIKPVITYVKLPMGRESRIRFYETYDDCEIRKGEKVLKL